jgi:hypothetical protein
MNVNTILGVTFILVFLYLILNRADSTNTIITGLADAYRKSVTVLQGREFAGI